MARSSLSILGSLLGLALACGDADPDATERRSDDGSTGPEAPGDDAGPSLADGGDEPTPTADGGDPSAPVTCGATMPRPRGTIPNEAFPDAMQGQPISGTLLETHHNQPAVLDGYLLLAGNAAFSTWDIADPSDPTLLAEFESEHHSGEAESHQLVLARRGDRFYAATISGKGFDIWDLTDMAEPAHVSHTSIDGIDYGDVAGAVWGLAWQGDRVYVGGNDTGLHIVDVSDPASPTVTRTLPNSETGGFFPGPLFAMGNLLVLTTPKNHGGVATLDIGNPDEPVLLDSLRPSDSYIGWFYGGHVFLQTPLRAYDVLSDPTSIATVLEGMSTRNSEYMSFADDQLFLGLLRPNPGVVRYDLGDMSAPVEMEKIEGRDLDGNDDQFSLKVGNILVLSDDQRVGSGYAGTILVAESTEPDTVPPRVNGVWPPDGASVPATSSVGLTFSDQIELATVNGATFMVREVDGDCVSGSWGHMRTVLSFTPDEPLESGATYEVVLPAGGITDPGGNALAEEYRTTFTVR